MPTHSGSLPHRFALLAGLVRKTKVGSSPVKAGVPATAKRPARVQAPAPQPGSRFAHLKTGSNAGLTTLLQPEKRATVARLQRQPQDLHGQMLAGMTELMRPSRRLSQATSREAAASILATAHKLQPKRF
jgi:hypothetical protein